MAELLSSKVIVVEEEPTIRGIPSAPTSVAAAVGTTERGPIGVPVLCNSFEEFQQRFGGFTNRSDLALAAMGFFQNGGSALWVVRTVHYEDPSVAKSATTTRASGSLVAARPENETIPTDPNALRPLVLRVEGKDPGAYGNRLQVEVRAPTSGEEGAFDLAVIQDGTYRELFANVRMEPTAERYVERLVNHPRFGSALISVLDQHAEGNSAPAIQTISLSGGDDGLEGLNDNDFVGSETGKTGLHAFDSILDLALLMVPGRASAAIHNAMVQYCEVFRDGLLFAVLDPPAGQTATDIVRYVESTASLLNLSEHAAIYWPRLKIPNPARSVFGSAEYVVAPPSGMVAGVFARTDAARPGGVYEAPAGIENGKLFGVLGLEMDEVLEERKRDVVYPKRINPITTGPGLPFFIDGSRTLRSTGNFPFVAERRGVSFVERSLKLGLQFARHRNNDESLRAQVHRTVTAFLLSQMNNGAFRSRDPKKAFFVDLSENDAAAVFAGRLNVRIGLATNKPAEFIVIRIAQDTRALESA